MKETNFKKNFIWNTLGSGMFAATSVILVIIVTRINGVTIAGQFSISQTTAQLTYFVGIFGVSNYQITDFSFKHTFSHYFTLRVLTCLLMIVTGVLLVLLLGFNGNKAIFTYFLIAFMLINAFSDVMQSFFFQKNRLDLYGKAQFFRLSISVFCFIAIISFTKNINLSLAFLIISNLIVTYFFAIMPFNKYKEQKVSLNIKGAKIVAKECLPLFITTLLMQIILFSPRYAIEFFLTDKMQGYFGIIFMPAMMICLFSTFVFKPILKRFSESLKKDINRFKKILFNQILIVFGISMFLLIVFYFFGNQIFKFVYNVDISKFKLEQMLLILGGGFYSLCILFYYILVILRKQKVIMINYIIISIFSLVICFFAVKLLGIIGGAAGFLISYIILSLLSFLEICRYARN